MERLKHTWLTDNLIDFEYKKYILLSYLQSVQKKFRSNKLYPQLADLVLHYNNLKNLKDHKELIFEKFPKRLTGMDIKKLKLTYEEMIRDDEIMNEISETIQFALPQLEKAIGEGKSIYEFVEDNLEFDTVGLMPIYNKEGYILLQEDKRPDIDVYRYRVSLFQHHNEEFSAINTTYVSQEVKSLSHTVESIKMDLVKRFKELPNPATFLITSKIRFPMAETLLPVAKRFLMRTVKLS